MQGGGHPGQQKGVDAIGLGKSAGRLCEAPGTLRIELYAWPISQRRLQRTVIGGSCLVGDSFDLPLPEQGHKGFEAPGSVGRLVFGTCGVSLAIKARFGDVDADGLW